MPEILAWVPQGIWLSVVVVVSVVALYLLPGLALLHLLWGTSDIDRTERAVLAFGIGVALPPLLLELAHLVHLPWDTWTLLVYIFIAALVVVRAWVSRRGFRSRLSFAGPPLLLSWMIGLVLLARLYSVRELAVGMWGDSYQHTMMAQLLVDNHGLFSSWEPYAPLATFTYHFGFHANVAFFHWLTGIPVTLGVVDIGVVFTAATVALAYLLTARLTHGRNVALWAALLTGFVNTLPGYLNNWGRYTQLTGQVILPVLLVCWMHALAPGRKLEFKPLLLAAIVTAGLALTHYIVAIFAALFVGVYLLALLAREPTWGEARRIAARAGVIGAVAVVLVLPWFLNTLGGYLTRNTGAFVGGSAGANRILGYSALLPVTPLYLKWYVLGLAGVGTFIALARRAWQPLLLLAWSLACIFAVIPNVFGLPGAGVVDQFTAYLALYLTVIPLAAYALGAFQEWLEAWQPRLVWWGAVAVMLFVSLWGVRPQQGQIDPQYELFTPADNQAMEWIRANTPGNSMFLVNSYPAYGGTLVAGTDGGWWIPLLTGRRASVPPLTYGSELGTTPDVWARVTGLATVLRGRPLTDPVPVRVDLTTPAALDALQAAGIRYVYSGAQARPGPDAADHIDTSLLQGDPHFRSVYASGGVEIFELESGS